MEAEEECREEAAAGSASRTSCEDKSTKKTGRAATGRWMEKQKSEGRGKGWRRAIWDTNWFRFWKIRRGKTGRMVRRINAFIRTLISGWEVEGKTI
jgi:hypothetical protein